MLWKSDIAASRTYQTPVTVESGRLRARGPCEQPGLARPRPGHCASHPCSAGRAIALRGRVGETDGGTADPGRTPARMAGVRAIQRCVDQHDHRRCRCGKTCRCRRSSRSRSRSPPCCCGCASHACHAVYACSVASTLAGLFALAWFALDARWIANLAQQTSMTLAQYGGKSTRDKHLAAEDGALYAFVEKARAVMPAHTRSHFRCRRHALLSRPRRLPPVSAQCLV